MKKTILLLVLIATALISSCDKDKKGEGAVSYVLEGTTWSKIATPSDRSVGTMKFTKTTVEFTLENGLERGTYSYIPPKITIVVNGKTVTGVVSGNTMNILGVQFIKQ